MVVDLIGRDGYGLASSRNIPLNEKYHYMRFIKQTLTRKVLPWRKVTKEECRNVNNTLLQYFASTAKSDQQFEQEKARIKETWPTVERYMYECPGLVGFMAEIGAHSRFFYPFLLDIPNGMAMLPAFFVGRDIFGKVMPIPSSDPMYRFCLNDPVFQSVRFRNQYEKQYLKNATFPLSLAGGTLPQIWYDGVEFDHEHQRLTVFDPDEKLTIALNQIFPEGLEAYGIDYHFEGFECARSERKHDLVTAMGLGSYNTDCLDELLGIMEEQTVSGGTILIDFQIMCKALIFDRFVLHWKTERPMKPSRNAKEIINKVKDACRENGKLTIVEYQIASSGAGIVFKISKK
mgnify:CR=1 FL=1